MTLRPSGRNVFLSTSSARRTTCSVCSNVFNRRHFYPRPPRGGRPARRSAQGICMAFLSTSSARRTTEVVRLKQITGLISIHVLREEDDCRSRSPSGIGWQFLSTSSARRTTPVSSKINPQSKVFLSTSSARRTTRDRAAGGPAEQISIHVLREEDDSKCDGK